MTKQEFLAMSLPYAVKILTHEEAVEITAIGTMQYQIAEKDFAYGWYGDIYDCKPILRPLSDLTKEIEHKGERFVPINRIKESQYHLFFRGDITSPLEGLQFSELRKLIEWHFDIADLISEGEAIDVNTLETNPYK